MQAVLSSNDRPLNLGSFAVVAGLHALGLWAAVSLTQMIPAVEAPKPLFVEFIAPPAPEPMRPPEPPPPRPVEKPRPKPLITTTDPTPAPKAIEAPPAPPQPEPLPPIEATPAPQAAAPAVIEPPRSDLAYLKNPQPTYPSTAKRLGEEGSVLLDVLVSAEGRVISLSIKKSSGYPRLDQAAMNAVRGWKFKPSRRGDTAIEGRAEVPVDFVLN
ncbi:MAG TPA: energy transducer TonB [Solimonas sp.]|nr:energy transducer TonB [Solimonas sp.]